MLLWHYTSVDVLASILADTDNPILRASHIYHLNDSAELKEGLNHMVPLLERIEATQAEEIKNLIDRMLEDEYDPNLYSFSLSEAKDSLYQWLAYCPAHGGIALGFELPELDAQKAIYDKNLFYVPLTKDSVQIATYRKCYYPTETGYITDVWIEPIKEGMTQEAHILTNAMFLKHQAFHFEKEHRLIFHPMPSNPYGIPILFNGNKPFINFHFKPEILKQIYISPRGNKKLTERTVSKIIAVKGLKNIQIVVSDIPFRE